MSTLGTYTLLAAFVACAYAAAAAVAGHRRHAPRLVESGIGAFYLVTALMTLASAIIVRAFVIGDYSIRYVDRYSDSIQPLFYRLTSYWGGLDGSIMFWVFLLSVFGAIAVKTNRERHRELIPYVIATIAVVQMFFLSIMILNKDPFATYLTQMPDDGRGLNPAAAEPVHGDPPAVALHGSGRHDGAVRVRDRGAHHRPPRRLVAARGAPLDDVLLVLPVARPDPGDDLGLRGSSAGAAGGAGTRWRTPVRCPGSRPRLFCTR